MRCLSVCQPFAHLIVAGRKTVELRSWSTRFRGEFLVHAPLAVRRADCRRLGVAGPLPAGAVVGRAELYGVREYAGPAEVRRDARLHLAGPAHRGSRYGFLLRNARALRVPVPCRGRLGFFDPGPLAAAPGDGDVLADIMDEEFRHMWIGRH